MLLNDLIRAENRELKRRCESLCTQSRLNESRCNSLQMNIAELQERISCIQESNTEKCHLSAGETVHPELLVCKELLIEMRQNYVSKNEGFSVLAEERSFGIEKIFRSQQSCLGLQKENVTLKLIVASLKVQLSKANKINAVATEQIASLNDLEKVRGCEIKHIKAQSDLLKSQLENERSTILKMKEDQCRDPSNQAVNDQPRLEPSIERPQQIHSYSSAELQRGAKRSFNVGGGSEHALKSLASRGCARCSDPSYGLMVRCESCYKEFHSTCARLDIAERAQQAGNLPKTKTGTSGFTCELCSIQQNQSNG